MAPDPTNKRGRQMGNDFSYINGYSYYHGEKVPGFPMHPHARLVTTLTTVLSGTVDHTDSLGGATRYSDGDFQIMTSGRGIQHAEMFPLLHEDKPNPLILFQIWLCAPAKLAKAEPIQKMFWRETIPLLHFPIPGEPEESNLKSEIRVMLGNFSNSLAEALQPPTAPEQCYASMPESDVAVWIVTLPKAGAVVKLPPAQSDKTTRAFYCYEGPGQVKITGSNGGASTTVVDSSSSSSSSSSSAVLSERTGVRTAGEFEVELLAVGGPTRIIMLQGKPIGEPIVQQGPFVTSTREDMVETMREFQNTQFGGWPWPDPDHVFPRDQKRFTKANSNAPIEYPSTASATSQDATSAASATAKAATTSKQ